MCRILWLLSFLFWSFLSNANDGKKDYYHQLTDGGTKFWDCIDGRQGICFQLKDSTIIPYNYDNSEKDKHRYDVWSSTPHYRKCFFLKGDSLFSYLLQDTILGSGIIPMNKYRIISINEKKLVLACGEEKIRYKPSKDQSTQIVTEPEFRWGYKYPSPAYTKEELTDIVSRIIDFCKTKKKKFPQQFNVKIKCMVDSFGNATKVSYQDFHEKRKYKYFFDLLLYKFSELKWNPACNTLSGKRFNSRYGYIVEIRM